MVDTILIDTLFVIKGMFGACGAAMLCCLCVVAGGQIGKKSPPPGTERHGRGVLSKFQNKMWKCRRLEDCFINRHFSIGKLCVELCCTASSYALSVFESLASTRDQNILIRKGR